MSVCKYRLSLKYIGMVKTQSKQLFSPHSAFRYIQQGRKLPADVSQPVGAIVMA